MRTVDHRLAVTNAFAAAAQGQGASPAPMHIMAGDGGFHMKGAGFGAGDLASGARAYVAFKVNGNFPNNPQCRGLPTIQGAIVLCDGETGSVLAVMDSIEVTLQRTAAASGPKWLKADGRLDAAIVGIRERLFSLGSILSSPAAADGVLFIGSVDGTVYALR